MNQIFRTAFAAIAVGFAIGSCKSDPLIFPEPSGSGGASSSSSDMSSTSSSGSVSASSGASTSSSSGQGNGGSGPDLPCDPCESSDGSRLIRNRTKTTGTDGLVSIQDGGIYDTLRQIVCYAQTAEDGVVRCLPLASVYAGYYFSDSACTIGVAYAFAQTCGSISKYAGETIQSQSCNEPTKLAFYGVGAEFVGQLYNKSSGTCATAQSLPSYKYYHLGNKVAPSEFVQLTVQTVP